jgi:transcriptional regulator with XRE-family HTH domain
MPLAAPNCIPLGQGETPVETQPLSDKAKLERVAMRVELLRGKTSQIELAKAAGVARKVIQRIEDAEAVSLDSYRSVADALFAPVDEIIPARCDDWQFKTDADLVEHARRRRAGKTPTGARVLDRIQIRSLVALDQKPQELAADEVPAAWLKLLMHFESSLSATNFVPCGEIFDAMGYADLGREAQKLQKKLGKTIRKILIAENQHELARYEPEMKKQVAAPALDVRYVLRGRIGEKPHLAAKLKKLASIDFQLFDDNIVLLWILNETTRGVEGGRILVGPQSCKVYADFFDALYREAVAYDPETGIS